MRTVYRKVAGTYMYETIVPINDKQLILQTRRIFSVLTTSLSIKSDKTKQTKELVKTKPNKFDKETVKAQHESINIRELVLQFSV